jgi:hypothetical protein
MVSAKILFILMLALVGSFVSIVFLFKQITPEGSGGTPLGIIPSLFKPKCTDTDNGKDYYTKGTCTDEVGGYIDMCIGNYLQEYYCSNNICETESFQCASCVEGTCIR